MIFIASESSLESCQTELLCKTPVVKTKILSNSQHFNMKALDWLSSFACRNLAAQNRLVKQAEKRLPLFSSHRGQIYFPVKGSVLLASNCFVCWLKSKKTEAITEREWGREWWVTEQTNTNKHSYVWSPFASRACFEYVIFGGRVLWRQNNIDSNGWWGRLLNNRCAFLGAQIRISKHSHIM